MSWIQGRSCQEGPRRNESPVRYRYPDILGLPVQKDDPIHSHADRSQFLNIQGASGAQKRAEDNGRIYEDTCQWWLTAPGLRA